MTRRLGGFRRRGFPALASLSLVSALACGGAITGCGGDDNGGGGGTAEDGGEDTGLGSDTAAPVGDSGADAAKDAATDGGKDSSTDTGAGDTGTSDTGVHDAALDVTVGDSGDATTPIGDGSLTGDSTTPDATSEGGTLGPVASVPTTTVGLGLANCGGAAVSTNYVVKNNGGGTLTVGASVAGSVFAVTPSSLSLTAGQSGTFSVSATVPASSTAGSTLSGSLVVTTNDSAHASTTVPLTAIAQGATLAWATGSPTDADFGVAPNGAPDSPIALTLTNTGNVAATAITFGTPTNAQFSLTPLTVATLAPAGTTAFSAGFTPNTLNSSTASSSISFTGAACGTALPALSFSGQGGIGAVTGWPSAARDVQGGAFGGAAPAALSFVLTNSGTVAAHIASVTPAGTAGYTSSAAAGATIAPNGGTLTVTITPPAIPQVSAVPGDFGGTLTFTTDVSGDSSHVVNVTEHAVGAILAFDTTPTGVNFGSFGPVPDGSALPQNFNIVNSGNAASNVNLTTTTPFSVSSAVFNLAGATTQGDTTTFTPTLAGGASALLTIAGDNLCQPVPAPLSLTGTGEGGGISISTQSIAFAADCGGAAATPATFTITNTGNLPMTWTAAGVDPALYTLSDLGPTVVQAGDMSTITVTPAAIAHFPPNTAPAAFGSMINITTDIVGDVTHTITLSETPHGDILTLVSSPEPIAFGNAPVNTVSQGPTFTIGNAANAGSAAAVVSIGLSGDDAANFSLASPTATVPAGSAGTPIGINFNAPGVPGLNSASLSIATDDVLCAPLPAAIAVTGTATEAGPERNPASIDFGLVNCGTTSNAVPTVTVSNTGTQDFTVTGIGVDNGIYTVSMSPPDGVVHVSPPSIVTITVTPGAIPANVPAVPAFPSFSGTLTINTNANVPIRC